MTPTLSPFLSFGAGGNSTALAILLINDGWKGEIIFADTGCEWPDTYCFMDYFDNDMNIIMKYEAEDKG